MKRLLFVLISLFLINPAYSFTQITTPTNNSIITQLNQTISTTITATENTSTFINWDNSLIGYWNFDYGNSTHVYDLSGYNSHGIYVSGKNNTNLNSIRGNYTSLNGISNYISTKDYSWTIGSPFTFSIWIKPNDLISNGVIFGKGTTSDWEYNLRKTGDDLAFTYWQGGATSSINIVQTNILNSNEWQLIIIEYNGSIANLYVNSILYNSGNSVGFFGNRNNNFQIGYGYYISSTDAYFNGSIDEVMIFNRSLSNTEIKSLYNSQINNFEFNVTNLNNLTNYNYEIFTTNTTGHLIKQSYNFYTNTSYTPQIIQTQTQSTTKLPSQSIISVIISIFVILSVLLI